MKTSSIPAVQDAGQAAAAHMKFYREMMQKSSTSAKGTSTAQQSQKAKEPAKKK